MKYQMAHHYIVNVPTSEDLPCVRFNESKIHAVGVETPPRESRGKYERFIRNCSFLLERVAFGFSKKPWMDDYGIAAHRALYSPLSKILLILPVECQGKVFKHRPHKLLDGLFHSAHPSVVAPLTDTRKPNFLVFSDLRRSVSKLTDEWLASDYPLQNPTGKQVFF